MPTYPQIFGAPGRNYTRDAQGRPAVTAKQYVVIHNTGGYRITNAADEASYATRRTDVRSAHYYADRQEVIQSLDTDWRAWHLKSRPGNDRGIAYEVIGWNSHSRDRWLSDLAWDALATQIARDAIAHHIEPRALTITQIRTGELTGIITGEQGRQAWGGTDRSGPGPHFPMDHLVHLVALKVAELTLHPEAPPPRLAPAQRRPLRPAAPPPAPAAPRRRPLARWAARALTTLYRRITRNT